MLNHTTLLGYAFVLASTCLFASGQASAATITKVNAAKKTVSIDMGTEAGLEKKSKLCFYDAGTKVGCGSVKSLGPKTATIRIKNVKVLPKLKIGLEARIEPVTSAAGGPAVVATATPAGESTEPFFTPAVFYGFPILNPVNYSNLVYQTPLGQDVSSMWSADSRVKSMSGAFEAGFAIGSMSLNLGLRGRFYTPKIIASDYDDADQDPKKVFEKYAETVATASAFGAYADFYYLNYRWTIVGLKIGNGIDFDSSKVNFEMVQKDDSTDEKNQLYKASSSLTAIALRTSIMLDFRFGLMGLRFGTVIFAPIAQTPQFKMAADDSPDAFTQFLQGKTPEEDLEKALEHNAKFAAELYVGANLNF